MKTIKPKKISESYKPLANEDHRAHRWAGGTVEKNRKKYTRKDKYKNRRYEWGYKNPLFI